MLALCRPGFEKECLAELTQAAAEQGTWGWASPEADSGFLRFQTDDAVGLYARLPTLVFSRELWPVLAEVAELPSADRISPLLEAMSPGCQGGLLFCDTAEGDAYRSTARFAGKFVHPLRQTMRQAGLLTERDNSTLPAWHVFFPGSSTALVGMDSPAGRPVWPMGAARLKFPSQAPSRSTLKLEEAFRVFLGAGWRDRLREASTAVDLGAAPGGWTWQLVRQELAVQAIDNGPMDEQLMASGLVEHLCEDGFAWQPDYPVDWLVCDMVESPYRVADRMLVWLENGWTRQAVFNLKLPMKKRWQTWMEIRDDCRQRLDALPGTFHLQAKHLYFDREEITVCIRPSRR